MSSKQASRRDAKTQPEEAGAEMVEVVDGEADVAVATATEPAAPEPVAPAPEPVREPTPAELKAAAAKELKAIKAEIAEIEAGNVEAEKNVAAYKAALAERERVLREQDELVTAARTTMERFWNGTSKVPGQMHRAGRLAELRARAEALAGK